MALAAMPGSVLWGGLYTLSYVLGMVIPLFIFSVFLDNVHVLQKFRQSFQKPVTYMLAGKKTIITLSEAISGVTFVSMGVLILYLAFTDKLFMDSRYQTDINIFLTRILDLTSIVIKVIPEYIWGLLFLTVIAFIVKISINQLKKEEKEEE